MKNRKKGRKVCGLFLSTVAKRDKKASRLHRQLATI
jgi:hypothetical protein